MSYLRVWSLPNESTREMLWQVKSLILILIALAALSPSQPRADDRILVGGLEGLDPSSTVETYSVGLALSGGGARGLSSIGILKAFEEKNIKVTAISGTSIGGIVGGLYACGYTPEQLITLIGQIEFSDLFSNQPSRSSMFLTQRQAREKHLLTVRFNGLTPYVPQGLTAGQKLTELLTRLTVKANYLADGDFTRLPIPFKTVCTDIVSGEKVILSSGSLADAMRATMAFPLAFTGVESGQQVLMDGGMVAPVPVSVVRGMTDTSLFVVAVNTSSPLLPKDELSTPIDIANQVTSIMTSDRLEAELGLADYVIAPHIDEYNLMGFKSKEEIIALGYEDGLTAADSIIARIRRRSDTVTYFIAQMTIESPEKLPGGPVINDLTGRRLNRRELVNYLKEITRNEEVFQTEATIHSLVSDTVSALPHDAVTLDISLVPSLPGPDTRVIFEGNRIFSDSMLLAAFDVTDTLITPHDIRAGIRRVEDLYDSSGYDLAKVSGVEFNFNTHEIILPVDEAIIKRIDVEHNDVTRDWLVRSYFPLHVGEPYSTAKASQGIANIYGTDLFNRVTVDLVHYDDGAIIKIGVQEKKHAQVRFGWHWDDAYQSEEFVEFLNDDAFGVGLEYLLHARYAQDRQLYFGQLRANRIFSTYLTTRLRAFFSSLDRSIFTPDGSIVDERRERKWGGFVLVGQQIARLGTVSGGLEIEGVKYRYEQTLAEERFNLTSLLLESQLETFDQWIFPESGNRHLLQLQLASKFLGGDREYTRFFSSFETYIPLGRYLNYHPKISIGLASTDLPPSEKFYMGGFHSFAGYRTYQLSGDKMFLVNQQLRIKLPFRFYLTGEYDLGQVYRSIDQVKLSNVRHGIGASIALDTPVGPFEFGYGFTDDDQDRYYFQAGFSF